MNLQQLWNDNRFSTDDIEFIMGIASGDKTPTEKRLVDIIDKLFLFLCMVDSERDDLKQMIEKTGGKA